MKRSRQLLFFVIVVGSLTAAVFADWDCDPLEPVFDETHTYWYCYKGPCVFPCSTTQVGEYVYCGDELISSWGFITEDECIDGPSPQCACE